MLKQEVFPTPETVTHFRTKALVDGAFHAALYWGAEGMSLIVQQFCFQMVFPLPDDRPGRGPFLYFGAPVGCETVFPIMVEDGADAASETPYRQRNRCGRKH